MNRIERKLYELISILSEKGNPALDKEISYKAKDGTTKKIVARSALRLPQEHPAHKEAEKIVKQNQAAEPKQKAAEKPTEKKPAQKPAEKKPTTQPTGQPAQQAQPVKIAAADFRTDAEKNAEKGPKPGVDMGKSFDKMKNKSSDSSNKKSKTASDNTKIKGTDIKVKPKIHKIPHKFRKQVNTKLSELLGEVEAEEKRAESVVLKDMGLNSKDELTDKNKEEFKTRMKKENKPPNLNLCKVSIPGTNLYCGKNKGLARDQMPQFKGKPVAGKPAANMEADPKTGLVDIEGMYRDHLKNKGIEISEPMEVAPESLKATQNELVGAQVVSMTKALDKNPQDEFITAPIYVTRDGYIVDGHHRWAAITGHNMKNPDRQIPMKVMVIDDDIENVIPDAINFADSQGIERMSGKTAGKDMGKGSSKPKTKSMAEKKKSSLKLKENLPAEIYKL